MGNESDHLRLLGRWKKIRAEAVLPVEGAMVLDFKADGKVAFIFDLKSGAQHTLTMNYQLDNNRVILDASELAGKLLKGTPKCSFESDGALLLATEDGKCWFQRE